VFVSLITRIHNTFSFYKTLSFRKRTCAKKTKLTFLVKVFTEGKKVVGKAFLSKNGLW
jgi:hypothetical protein